MKVKCDKCDYVAKSENGLKAHVFRKHTKRGQELAKAAASRMNSPEVKKRAVATREANKKLGLPSARSLRLKQQGQSPEAKKQRAPWGSLSRKPARRIAARRSLQHAAIHQVRFCPNCACNLEAVSVAMSFAAVNR